MSKASEWAGKFLDATREVKATASERPLAFVMHLCGPAMLYIEVDDDGRPVISLDGIDGKGRYTMYSENDQKRVQEAAHWILDTFEDKA